MRWLLVGIIVAATTAGQILQAAGMRQHGEVHITRPGAVRRMFAWIVRNELIIASVVAMAISFFAFLSLVSITDLSFAVPATAASFVLETVLAKYILKERVNGKRWAGAALVACGVALLSL